MVEVTPQAVWYYLAIFDFIFLAFEPYHMVDPPSVLSSLSVFGVSFPIKGPVQSQFQLLILRYTFD